MEQFQYGVEAVVVSKFVFLNWYSCHCERTTEFFKRAIFLFQKVLALQWKGVNGAMCSLSAIESANSQHN